VRLLILKQDNTCQLTQDGGIGQNASLPSSAVFENLSNLVDSHVKRNFNIVYEKIQNIECSKCDYETTICFNWRIEKNWYKRYLLGPKFNPTRDKGFLRGPCAVILDFIQAYRFIDLGTNNALAIRDIVEEIGDLKRKFDENDGEKQNKDKNNTPTPTTTILAPTTTNLPTTTTITIPTPTTSLPTTTTTITFSKPYTNIDITTTKTTKTTTVLQTTPKTVLKTTTTIPKLEQFDNLISCPIYTICDKLNLKKQSTAYDKMREIINKLTDVQVKDLVDKIQKLIKQY
ncbi:18389_t:CDS:2, partial [Dentiscutata erythropus]